MNKFSPGALAWHKQQHVVVEIISKEAADWMGLSEEGTPTLWKVTGDSYRVVSLGRVVDVFSYTFREFSCPGASLIPLNYEDGKDQTLTWKDVPLPKVKESK